MIKRVLNDLFEHKRLTREDAREVLLNIAKGDCNESEIAAFLTIFIMRAITVEELAGFRDALLELCVRMDFSDFNTIDLCGTGGDGKNTFNISTLSSFVVAGAGGKVAKHGNYGVSSMSGSSNVMEYLGYTFKNDEGKLRRELDEAGICFMHAPLFHPAMKNVAPVRKQLGVKTFFNMLGPMVNPSFPSNQLVGVFNLEIARLYQYLYQQSGKNFIILHSLDGYDEISLTGSAKAISNKHEWVLQPQDLGLKKVKPEALAGGNSIKEAAGIFVKVLKDECTEAQKSAVTANVALALRCLDNSKSLESCVDEAKRSIESGSAYQSFKKLIELNKK